MTSWSRYMQGSEGRWAFRRERLHLPDHATMGGEALRRDPWQRRLWDLVDDRDAEIVMAVGSRGTGKTVFGAAVALERLALERDHEVIAVANDADQARLVHDAASGFIRRDPTGLGSICTVYRDSIVNQVTASRLRVMTHDAVSSYGLGGKRTTFIVDEIWGFRHPDLLHALLSALPKCEGSTLYALSNAGFTDSPAYELLKLCKSGDPAFRYWDSYEEGVWPSWMDPAERERQRVLLPPSVFERLFENRWSTGAGDLMTLETAEAAVDDHLNPASLVFDPRRSFSIGVDIGVRNDETAVVVGHREGRVFVTDHIQTFSGTPEHPVSLEHVTAYLAMLARRIRRLRRVFVDPWQTLHMIERLRKAGIRCVEEFTFTVPNVMLLSQSIWNHFHGGIIRIPHHPQLIDQAVRAQVKEGRRHWRIDHAAGEHNDVLVALGLAIVASLDDPGELILEDHSDTYLIRFFKDRLHSRHYRLFGFGRLPGLHAVVLGGPNPTDDGDVYSAVRLLQLLQATERISNPEAEAIAHELRGQIWRNPKIATALRCTVDTLDERFGPVGDFCEASRRTPKADSQPAAQLA